MRIECIETAIPEVKFVRPDVFRDTRGFFLQNYHERQYRDAGIGVRFVQDNWSRSTKGTLRGLHYQLRHAQDKLVSVIRGKVFDVVVDVRRGSPTFGRWIGAELVEEQYCQLFIPKGFAHGFCVLSDEADFVYKCSDFYTPNDEHTIHWSDPRLAIKWPAGEFIVSGKDNAAPQLKDIPLTDLPVY